MAEGVVDLLEAVEVEQDDAGGRAGGQRAVQGLEERPPVGQTGQRVVQGVVGAVGGLLAQPVDERAVLQRHARLVGEGLQCPQVAGLEPGHLAEAVGDDEDAARAAGVHRRRSRLLSAGRVEHRALVGVLGATGEEQPPAVAELGEALQPVPARGGAVPRGAGAVHAAVEVQLGPLGLEHLAGPLEHRVDDRLAAVGRGQGLGDAVVALEAGVGVLQLLVRAVGDHEHAQHHEQQRHCGGGALEQDDDQERRAGVAQRDDQPPRQGLLHGVAVEGPLVQGDDGGDREGRHLVGDHDGHVGAEDGPEAGRLGAAAQQAVQGDREGGLQREQPGVEEQPRAAQAHDDEQADR